MKRTFFLLAIAIAIAVGNAAGAVIASFDATLGAPDTQGWSLFEVEMGDGATKTIAGGTANMEMTTDGGEAVLHALDQLGDSSLNLPTFYFDRTEAQDEDLFNNGLKLTIVMKNIGGWSMSMGFNDSTVFQTAANIGSDTRVTNFNSLAADDTYHTIVIDGAFDGTDYIFTRSIDGIFTDVMPTGGNSSNGAFDGALHFQAGSSSGTGKEAMFKSVTLESVPEPATMVLLGLGGLMLRRRRS